MDLISEMYAANPDMTIVVVSAWRFEEDVLAALRRRLGLCVQERDDIEVGAAIRRAERRGAAGSLRDAPPDPGIPGPAGGTARRGGAPESARARS